MNSSENRIIALIQQSEVDVSALAISKDGLILEIIEEESYEQYVADIDMVEKVARRFLPIHYVYETCSDEYELPETYNEECPICGCDTLYPIDIEASTAILNDYMERVLK